MVEGNKSSTRQELDSFVFWKSGIAPAVWHVGPFCRDQMLPISSSLVFVKKTWHNNYDYSMNRGTE